MKRTVPGTRRPQLAPWRGRPASQDLASLEERLGLLLVVRLSFALLVLAGSVFDPGQLHITTVGVAPLSAGYVVLAAAVEWYRRSELAGRMMAHRFVLPLDAVYLAAVTTPSGGPRSPLLVLFAVQLIAVTLLVSARAGLRMALWDTFLFLLIPGLSLYDSIAALLHEGPVVAPSVSASVLAVAGFWVVAVCTAVFSGVSERELRRSKAEMSALADMASGLEGLRDEDEILGLLLRTLLEAFPLERGAIWYTKAGRPAGLVMPRVGADPLAVAVPTTPDRDRVALEAWRLRAPRLVRRLDPVHDPVATTMLHDAGNVVVLPIQLDGGDSGVVMAEHGGAFHARLPRRTVMMLAQFAAHTALALGNARLLAERERLAAIDGLTGLANRRKFDEVLAHEVARVRRTHEPLSLVVFDVDHFKMINDTRGHLGGDEVLRSLAQVLDHAVREMDLAARYGGEEFALVLPRCDQHDAIRIVERVTEGIRRCPDLAGITLSSGVATIPFNAEDGTALVAAADEALYESKRAGRNRYSVSGARAGRPASV